MKKEIVLLLMGLTWNLQADYAHSVDEDGCWDALDQYGSSCMVVDHTKWDDTTFRVYYKNSCSHRIYTRSCNGRTSKDPECISTSIQPGKVSQHYTYHANGQYNYRAIGSVKSSADWVCAGKVSDWND